jgi:L-alanine-DL-glutamate epimerase-like enolase superfamily enzyme
VTLPIPALLDELEARLAQGYQTIKIRIGCGRESADDAIARARAARKFIGNRARLGVDAGQQIFVEKRWPIEDALRVTQALGELDVLFFEEPYLITDLAA